MLTREKSAANRLLKYSATLPLVLLLVVFCTQTSFSGIRSGNNKVKFNGNEIEFGSLKVIPYEYRETMEQQKRLLSYTTLPDSVLIKDPLTGIQKWYTVKSDIMPVSINGQHIFGNEEQYMLGDAEKNYSLPVLDGSAKGIYEYLFNALKDDLDKLEDGGYALQVDKMVVDYDGKLAYYEVEGLRISMSSYERWPLIGQDLKQSIDNRLKKILSEQIRFKPAVKDGKPINVRTTPGSYEIIVKDHKARLAQIQGC